MSDGADALVGCAYEKRSVRPVREESDRVAKPVIRCTVRSREPRSLKPSASLRRRECIDDSLRSVGINGFILSADESGRGSAIERERD